MTFVARRGEGGGKGGGGGLEREEEEGVVSQAGSRTASCRVASWAGARLECRVPRGSSPPESHD